MDRRRIVDDALCPGGAPLSVPRSIPIRADVLIGLAFAARVAAADDAARLRAIDAAVAHIQADLPYEFDGAELRVTSYSRSAAGVQHVTDGVDCTCEARRHPWCRHRAMYRLFLAAVALLDPTLLKAKLLEQLTEAAPADDGFPADSIFDYFPPDDQRDSAEEAWQRAEYRAQAAGPADDEEDSLSTFIEDDDDPELAALPVRPRQSRREFDALTAEINDILF